MSNRVKKGIIKLDDSLFILDESHNLLYPPTRYKDQYDYLVTKIKQANNIKVLLLTATPVFKSLTDSINYEINDKPFFKKTKFDFEMFI